MRGGPIAGPPPDISTAAFKEDARARVDIDGTNVPIIDRLLKAKAKNFDTELIHYFRDWLHGYMAKLGPELHPHAPDDLIVSQFLSCGEPGQLGRLLDDLLAAGQKPNHSYAWFVTVALQRLHGISPQQLKQRRSQLQLVKKQHQSPEQQQAEAIQQQISEMAQDKQMRFHRSVG